MVASEFKLLGNEQDVFPDVDELFQEIPSKGQELFNDIDDKEIL